MSLKVLIAIDKFKGTYSSCEIASIIAQKLKKVIDCTTEIIPVSDGGQGFLDSFLSIGNYQKINASTFNAALEPIETYYLAYEDTCYIESSKMIGMDILAQKYQNPCKTSSFGLGEVIKKCIEQGYKKIVVGLGGSATNDAGIGMAEALGAIFKDKEGNMLKTVGENLEKIYYIDSENLKILIQNIEFIAFCDVENPLFGHQGAAYCFAQQKGANSNEVIFLDKGLQNIFRISKYSYKTENQKFFGSAGGLGFAFKFFFNAKLYSGAEEIINLLNIENKIENCDLLITGEGKFDKQSMNGKITGKLIDLAQKKNKKVIVLCGLSEEKFNKDKVQIINLFEEPISNLVAKEQTLLKINQIDFKKIFF